MNMTQINPFFQELKIDHLYHLGMDTEAIEEFGQIDYVLFTLSNKEASIIANEIAKSWYSILIDSFSYLPIYKTERFHIYKVATILVIAIGVGAPSLLIALNEITKLLVHTKNYNAKFIKIGFSRGIGAKPGDIIISNNVINNQFENIYQSIECGRTIPYTTKLDQSLIDSLLSYLAQPNIIQATVLSTNDFYDGQGQVANILPNDYNLNKAAAYLTQAYNLGVRTINMESLVFAGFCNQLAITACTIEVIIVDRLSNEYIESSTEEQTNFLANISNLLANYIKDRANNAILI